jgi:hypothetical protein
LSDAGIQVTVACRTLETAKQLCEGLKNCNPISLDVTNESALDAEVAKNALVVSLIPYTFHAVSGLYFFLPNAKLLHRFCDPLCLELLHIRNYIWKVSENIGLLYIDCH